MEVVSYDSIGVTFCIFLKQIHLEWMRIQTMTAILGYHTINIPTWIGLWP